MAGVIPTDTAVMTSLRTFLLGVTGLPDDSVIKGQDNRVPSPLGPDYVIMTPGSRNRMATNQEAYAEPSFAGSITGDVLTITAMLDGTLAPGQALSGDGVAPGSLLVAPLGGAPGAEMWRVSPAQTVAQGILFAGGLSMSVSTMVTVQLDVYGPRSADLAQIVMTTLRSGYACDAMASYGLGVTPCYTSDPRQLPFWSGEMQTENRWMLDAVLQVTPVVTVPQQFAGAVEVGIIEVDERYPPGEAAP